MESGLNYLMYATAQKPLCFFATNLSGRGKITIMADENGTGSNAVWAIALIIVVAIIAGVVYYSGILKTGPKKSQVDINVTAPAAPAPAAPAAPAR